MTPAQLQPNQFRAYPPEAYQLAVREIELLRKLPLGFLPLLLRELAVYDWKFPAERKEMERQFAYLNGLSPAKLSKTMLPFSQLRLTPELESSEWAAAPALFSEQLSAHLWASHQIESFRAAAVAYVQESNSTGEPLPVSRLGIAVIGQGVTDTRYPLFQKLRQHGVHFSKLSPSGAYETILQVLADRSARHPLPYAHWYIDGAANSPATASVTCVSYAALTPARARLQGVMQKSFESGTGSETLRTNLAQMSPESAGLRNNTLDRFQVSLLTEGSGTQIFSTTFVQWAAREALRRAQPLTLLARFAPRQSEQSMKELLSESQRQPALDAAGSLIDADMGAYYNYLNQQRLSGSNESRFFAWFQDHEEAVAIGPNFPPGTQSTKPVTMQQLLA